MTEHLHHSEHDDRRRTLTEADIQAIVEGFKDNSCVRTTCQFDADEIRALKDFVELFSGLKSNVLKTLYLFFVLLIVAVSALAFKHGIWPSAK